MPRPLANRVCAQIGVLFVRMSARGNSIDRFCCGHCERHSAQSFQGLIYCVLLFFSGFGAGRNLPANEAQIPRSLRIQRATKLNRLRRFFLSGT